MGLREGLRDLDELAVEWTFTSTVGDPIIVSKTGVPNAGPINEVSTTVTFNSAGLYRAELAVTDDDTGRGEAVMETLRKSPIPVVDIAELVARGLD